MTKYFVKYSPETTTKPIFAEAILSTKVKVNILTAKLDKTRGLMVLEVLGNAKETRRLVSYLKKRGLSVEKVEGNILKDDVKCVDCGVCVGVCPTDAISMKDLRMVLDNKKCIFCRACVEVCPTKAISVREVL
jgi:formate hydrogenlyase subunit 6/NADH:ubiquinone oxidoreductase subunit I